MIEPVEILHFGSLHPYEQGLTLLLAFGPFAMLAAVLVVRRRQDQQAESQADQDTSEPSER